MKPKIFIDGEHGTTGLQIRTLLAGREDLEVISIPTERRKEREARAEYLNAADVAILCLPDDAARESVSLIENDTTRVIDASTAHLVRNPERFDVICATNFYGDIISDLASELSGSLGLAGSMMASDTHCCAQAQHGSAPDIQNQDKANPVSMILSCGMLLQWLGEKRSLPAFERAFHAIDKAIDEVLDDPASRTPDLGGKTGTKRFGQLVAETLKAA